MDYNALRVRIPARSGPGHYVVHWRWSGYSDCVDVDVLPKKVTHIYGQPTSTFVWNRVDHCQYIKPYRVATPCMLVTKDAKACIDLVEKRYGKKNNRFGVSVVPFSNPASVKFRSYTNIPWPVSPLSASRSLRRALLTPRVNPGSLYRCRRST